MQERIQSMDGKRVIEREVQGRPVVGTRLTSGSVPAMVPLLAALSATRQQVALLTLTTALTALSLPWTMAGAQEAAGPTPLPVLPQTSVLLQPTLGELRSTIAGLHIAKWKAPGPVKDDAQGNAGSIDRDLSSTLPALMAQADAAPHSVGSAFAVYRNLDALYEVLLRVSGTAELAAPDDEAANLAHSLLTLEAARRSLADSILSASHTLELAAQPPPPPRPAPAPLPPAPTQVINDGPVAAPVHRKAKPKPKTVPPAAPQG